MSKARQFLPLQRLQERGGMNKKRYLINQIIIQINIKQQTKQVLLSKGT